MISYWICFGLQTAGASIMLWKGIPIYRNLLSNSIDPGNRNLFLALVVLLLIQPAFWIARKKTPYIGEKHTHKVVLGHVVLFLGRIVFVFVGGLFSAVFYMTQFHFSIGVFMLVALLFSMFCYTLELEKISKALI